MIISTVCICSMITGHLARVPEVRGWDILNIQVLRSEKRQTLILPRLIGEVGNTVVAGERNIHA